jgi:CDP-glucose 4,6-dehydratase
MGGNDPYSNSKGCAELVTTAYVHSYFAADALQQHGVGVASARAGNAIAGGDWTPDQLIPDLMRSFAAAEPCLIRSPKSVRPWQFVLEPLRGYLLLAERLATGDPRFISGWNFGPATDDAKPVSWIADRLRACWGGDARWTTDERLHPPEASTLRLDASKASQLLGWNPALPLGVALDWIAEWYGAWQRNTDLAALTREQIARYEGLLN